MTHTSAFVALWLPHALRGSHAAKGTSRPESTGAALASARDFMAAAIHIQNEMLTHGVPRQRLPLASLGFGSVVASSTIHDDFTILARE